MSHSREYPTVCSEDGCEASFPGSKWGAMKASREGWFQQKNGQSWCPLHVPAWVKEWRSRR